MHELRRAAPGRRGARRPADCRRSTTARSTPRRCGSCCCTTPGAGACRPRWSSRCCPHLEAALGWLTGRRRRRRRLRRVRRPLAATGWPTRAGRTPATPCGSATAALADGADRAVRGAGLRVRGGRGARPRCWTRSAGPAPTAGASRRAALAERFRERFWVEDRPGAYPALALDGAGRPVDSLTSNIGHLLGTGLLDAAEAAAVAAAAGRAGHGLRLRAADDVDADGGFNPLVLPLRLGVAARHRDRAAGLARGG